MPSHYLNQCWNIVNLTLRNVFNWNCISNSKVFIQEMHLKMSSAKWKQFCLGLNVLALCLMAPLDCCPSHHLKWWLTAELPTCTHFVYFVHKNSNMKFVHRIQAFVHINKIHVFTGISTLALNKQMFKMNFRVYPLLYSNFWTDFQIVYLRKIIKPFKYCVVVTRYENRTHKVQIILTDRIICTHNFGEG